MEILGIIKVGGSMVGFILLVIFVLLIVLGLPCLLYIENNKIKAETQALRLKAEQALALEKMKPLSRVVFEVKGLGERYSDYLEPEMGIIWEKSFYTTSSYDNCVALMTASMTRGYFKDNEGITYPSCNIVRVWVEQEK